MNKLVLFVITAASLLAQVARQNTNNTYTGYNNMTAGSWRPPEKTVSTLPSAASSTGKVYVVTDGASASDCTVGGATTASTCRSNGSAWVGIGGGGGTGNMTVTTGAIDPTGACTTGLSWYVNTTASPKTAWFCDVSGTWQKVLSTLGSGTFLATGSTGTSPGTPAAGLLNLYFDSTSKVPTGVNDAGTISTMVKNKTCTAGDFVSDVTNGTATCTTPAGGGGSPAGSNGDLQMKAGASFAASPMNCITAANVVTCTLTAGSAQGFNTLLSIKDSGGTERAAVLANTSTTYFLATNFGDLASVAYLLDGSNARLDMSPSFVGRFGSTTLSSTKDTGFRREAAGVFGITDGSTGWGKLAVSNSTPTASADACTPKSLWADASFVYVCTASGVIKRVAIAVW